MDELVKLIRQLIIAGVVICVVVIGFFFISAQVQLSNRQAVQADAEAATCHRWATHTEDEMDRLVGKLQVCR